MGIRMLILAFRNIFRNRWRTALTLAAISSGVAAVVVSGGFVEDVFHQLRESTIHSSLGHIQIFARGFLEGRRREPARYTISNSEHVADLVRLLPHVEEVLARLDFTALANNGRADLPIIGEGVDAEKETRLGTATTLVAGRELRDSDLYGAVVGEGVARALQLHPGDHVTLMASSYEGALNTLDVDVVGIIRTISKDYDNHIVRVPLAAAQGLLSTDLIHTMVVLLDDTSATSEVAAALKAMLKGEGLDVKSWRDLADFYEKTVALYKRQFGALQAVILAMLLLSVVGTVNMSVYERTGEFGTLLAMGCRRRHVFGLVVVENTILGLLGAAIGICVGIAFAAAVSRIGIPMPPPPGSNAGYAATIRLSSVVMAAAAAIGILAAGFAAVLPARRAARLDIVYALRHNI